MGKAEQRLTESLDAATRTGNHYGRLATDIFLERVHAVRGELRQAEAYCQEILKYAPAGPLLALVFQDLSTFNYEWNDLETAWKFLRMGEELCQNTGNQEFLVGNHILEVRLHLAQDQLGAAIDTLTRSHRQVKDNDLPPPTRARRAACNFDLSLSQNDLQAAQTWIELAGANVHSHSFYRFLGINPARLLLASGMKDAARESLLDCLTQVEKHGWGYGLIATRSLLALAADTEEDALNHLRYALEWAQSQGHIRTIIETGDELIPLLEELARKGFNPGYLGQLLAVIKGQKVSITVSRHTLIEPLSDRELEVLRLVAAGLSNREIAAKLILSLGTVKSHVHNIYGKLGVRNRTEAVTRAQEYQLL
jgi:LuxR family maltose regulon positive regulatory protein